MKTKNLKSTITFKMFYEMILKNDFQDDFTRLGVDNELKTKPNQQQR